MMGMIMPLEPTSSNSIWLALIGIATLVISTFAGPAALDWAKDKIARRGGRTPPVPPAGLNAPIDVHTPGVTGFSLNDLINTIGDTQHRLDVVEKALGEAKADLQKAHTEIQGLQQAREYDKTILGLAIQWGMTAEGIVPRPVPDYLRAYRLENDSTP